MAWLRRAGGGRNLSICEGSVGKVGGPAVVPAFYRIHRNGSHSAVAECPPSDTTPEEEFAWQVRAPLLS